MIASSAFFKLAEGFPFSEFFCLEQSPWSWLPKISEALQAFDFAAAKTKDDIPPQAQLVGDQIYIHPTVKIFGSCYIEGPVYIGAHSQIRPNAFIRGNVIVGEGCVLGNACEYKNCLLLDRVETPHYNYVGDSILGNQAHLGAGVILANLRLDKKNVIVQTPDGREDSGLRKLGAILGDGAEVGCNAALQPGTLLAPKSMVMPTEAFGGYLAPGKIGRRKK